MLGIRRHFRHAARDFNTVGRALARATLSLVCPQCFQAFRRGLCLVIPNSVVTALRWKFAVHTFAREVLTVKFFARLFIDLFALDVSFANEYMRGDAACCIGMCLLWAT